MALRPRSVEGAGLVARGGAPELLGAARPWVRSLWEGVSPRAPQFGTYVGSLTEADGDRVRRGYVSEKYDRLAGVKAT